MGFTMRLAFSAGIHHPILSALSSPLVEVCQSVDDPSWSSSDVSEELDCSSLIRRFSRAVAAGSICVYVPRSALVEACCPSLMAAGAKFFPCAEFFRSACCLVPALGGRGGGLGFFVRAAGGPATAAGGSGTAAGHLQQWKVVGMGDILGSWQY